MFRTILWCCLLSSCVGLLLGCSGPVAVADCAGVPDGAAFVDGCGTCVGGDTGLTACLEDCNGDLGGEAVVDGCGTCVGGETGLTACVEDCNGDFGGEAFVDECGACVGGETGLTACVEDCNGDFGGEAHVDECGACVGGETGLTACVRDCHGDLGGTAVLDGCGQCRGGETGVGLCTESCGSLDEPGTRYISLTAFDWAWPERYTVEETEESIFNEVKRVSGFVVWLEVRENIHFPAGRWSIDTRISPNGSYKWELGAVPEADNCVSEVWSQWTPSRVMEWQVSPEPLLLDVSEACSVQMILKAVEDPSSKSGTTLDWIRIRHACSVDADCPVIEDSSLAMCLSGACRYDEACFPPE